MTWLSVVNNRDSLIVAHSFYSCHLHSEWILIDWVAFICKLYHGHFIIAQISVHFHGRWKEFDSCVVSRAMWTWLFILKKIPSVFELRPIKPLKYCVVNDAGYCQCYKTKGVLYAPYHMEHEHVWHEKVKLISAFWVSDSISSCNTKNSPPNKMEWLSLCFVS